MAEVHEDLIRLEDQLMKIRCELRNLKGLAALFSQQLHPNKYDRSISANNQSANRMAKQITLALNHLEQYDLYKSFYFNQEKNYESIIEMMER